MNVARFFYAGQAGTAALSMEGSVFVRSVFETLAEHIHLILSAVEILPLELLADREYAALRHHLTR
ncbi:MAG: hypothetical protein PsegKO_32730 [Pseudohongiellaceae bacterium]